MDYDSGDRKKVSRRGLGWSGPSCPAIGQNISPKKRGLRVIHNLRLGRKLKRVKGRHPGHGREYD